MITGIHPQNDEGTYGDWKGVVASAKPHSEVFVSVNDDNNLQQWSDR